MKRDSVNRLVKVREGVIQKAKWKVVKAEEHGLRRIALSDGTALVDVWLTTGSWGIVGSSNFKKNDWSGFLRYMAVME